MDRSTTRRGKPCWYLVPDVKMDAVNDSLILESFMYFLIKLFFDHDSSRYLQLVDLYHEVRCPPAGAPPPPRPRSWNTRALVRARSPRRRSSVR
jgi:hypothetical protein